MPEINSMKFEAPIKIGGLKVLPDWIDYNGHMNVAFYVHAFDLASDEVFDFLGAGASSARERAMGPFSMQNQVCYLREVMEGTPLSFTYRMLDHDHKRVHFFMEMFNAEEGYLAATMEQLTMNVDLEKRASAGYTAEVLERIERLFALHKDLERPPQVGAAIGIRRKG